MIEYTEHVDKEGHKTLKAELPNGRRITLHPWIDGTCFCSVWDVNNKDFEYSITTATLEDAKEWAEITADQPA